MPYDEQPAARVRDLVPASDGLAEKTMFGGRAACSPATPEALEEDLETWVARGLATAGAQPPTGLVRGARARSSRGPRPR